MPQRRRGAHLHYLGLESEDLRNYYNQISRILPYIRRGNYCVHLFFFQVEDRDAGGMRTAVHAAAAADRAVLLLGCEEMERTGNSLEGTTGCLEEMETASDQ